MKVLIDFDSLLYSALYKVVSFGEIKQWIKDGKRREWMESKIMLESNERLANMSLGIIDEIWEGGIEFEMSDVNYYLTSDIFSHRKQLAPSYKAQRKGNKWVRKLRTYIIENETVNYSLEWESDDLIFNYAKELKEAGEEYLIASVDKDLRQIEGWHFDLYREKTGEVSEYGQELKRYRGLLYVSKAEAEKLVWLQMLMGDGVDNIKGIKGIGKVKAEKLLSGMDKPSQYFMLVARKYKECFQDWKQEFKTNYRLLKLGF